MAIIIVSGDPGNGKGIKAMQFLEQAHASGRQIYTNIKLRPECPFADDVALLDDPEGKFPVYRGTPAGRDHKGRQQPASEDYCAFWHYVVPNSVVMLDEADAYFDCSDHSAVGADIRLFHKQHRKLKIDLIYIVQSVENLYIRIRRLTQRFVHVEWNWRSMAMFQQMAGVMGVDRTMLWTRFLCGEFGKADLSPKSFLSAGYISYREARDKYFKWYDTEQIIGDTSHLKWAADGSVVRDDDGASGVPA
jgi:hypothetical protein